MLKKSNLSLKSYNEKLRSELDTTKERLFHVENILTSIQKNKEILDKKESFPEDDSK